MTDLPMLSATDPTPEAVIAGELAFQYGLDTTIAREWARGILAALSEAQLSVEPARLAPSGEAPSSPDAGLVEEARAWIENHQFGPIPAIKTLQLVQRLADALAQRQQAPAPDGLAKHPTLDGIDDREAMRQWRECGLPEHFLGNGGTNVKLTAFHRAAYKQGWNDREDDMLAGVERVTGRAPAPERAGFDAWLDEVEGFGLRRERLIEDLGENYRNALPWLQAAFEQGRKR